ncbi:hypothetical protein [Microbacterium mangrovi]|nr:hypothetical protein [Microbacterium mangrovi]
MVEPEDELVPLLQKLGFLPMELLEIARQSTEAVEGGRIAAPSLYQAAV